VVTRSIASLFVFLSASALTGQGLSVGPSGGSQIIWECKFQQAPATNTIATNPGATMLICNAVWNGTSPWLTFSTNSPANYVCGLTTYNTNLADNLTNATYSIWVKETAGSSMFYSPTLFAKVGPGGGPSGTGWLIQVAGLDAGAGLTNIPAFFVQNSGGAKVLGYLANSRISDGNWHWIVATTTGSTGGATAINIYLDGVLGTTNANTGTWSAGIQNNNAITVGYDNVGESFGNGSLGDAKILNVAKTQAQIQSAYSNAYKAAIGAPAPPDQLGTAY
jgi:hypothetical protein